MDRPPLPQDVWDTIPPATQAAVLVLALSLEQRIADLEERVNKNSTNSSKPLLGSSLGQATTCHSPLGQETRRATWPPPSCSHSGPVLNKFVRFLSASHLTAESVGKTSKAMTLNRFATRSPKCGPSAPSLMNTGSIVWSALAAVPRPVPATTSRFMTAARFSWRLAACEGKIQLHFLPPYCPDHNRIERIWKDLHDKVTRNHCCKEKEERMAEVYTYLRCRSRRGKHCYPKRKSA